MSDLVNRIEEATKKPSFEEFFFNKKNKKMIYKVFIENYEEGANEAGQDLLDSEFEDTYIEMSPDEAYENDAHNQGYGVEYDAAYQTIFEFKNKYDYQRDDESDEEKQVDIVVLCGYSVSFTTNHRKEKEIKDKVKKYSK